jgi:hypothetical protein
MVIIAQLEDSRLGSKDAHLSIVALWRFATIQMVFSKAREGSVAIRIASGMMADVQFRSCMSSNQPYK